MEAETRPEDEIAAELDDAEKKLLIQKATQPAFVTLGANATMARLQQKGRVEKPRLTWGAAPALTELGRAVVAVLRG